jgi:hypothetical protein
MPSLRLYASACALTVDSNRFLIPRIELRKRAPDIGETRFCIIVEHFNRFVGIGERAVEAVKH